MTGREIAIEAGTMNAEPGILVGQPLRVVEEVDWPEDGNRIRVPFLLHAPDPGLFRPIVDAPVLETSCQQTIGLFQYTFLSFIFYLVRLSISTHVTYSQLLLRWLPKASNRSKWASLGPRGWLDRGLLCSSRLIHSSKSTLLVHRSDLWAGRMPRW